MTLRYKGKHRHERRAWVTVGYGGAGWHLIRCSVCGEVNIA